MRQSFFIFCLKTIGKDELGARASSEVPNIEKLMKAQGLRPSAFIVSPLMIPDAKLFEMTSPMKQYQIF